MSINVILGGNGYIGRELTRQWLAADPNARFLIVSSSGTNTLEDARVQNIKADATDYESLAAALPEKIDSIVNLLGRPGKDEADNQKINIDPTRAAARLTAERGARIIGFIGGKLGPGSFTRTKAALLAELREGELPVAAVEPTVIYGAGRKDAISRMVPLFKFLGLFNPNFKPVQVQDVVGELLQPLLAATR